MKKPGLGRAESEVLRYVADRGGATVTEVGDYLAETKGQTRSTAANMLERLRSKGFLDREKIEGLYRYTLAESKEPMYGGFIDDFVNTVLGGSAAPLAMYLSQRAEIDKDQLKMLQALVKSLEESDDDA